MTLSGTTFRIHTRGEGVGDVVNAAFMIMASVSGLMGKKLRFSVQYCTVSFKNSWYTLVSYLDAVVEKHSSVIQVTSSSGNQSD